MCVIRKKYPQMIRDIIQVSKKHIKDFIIKEFPRGDMFVEGQIITPFEETLIGYTIHIDFNRGFRPKGMLPKVYEIKDEIKYKDADAHFYPDKSFCLGIQGNTVADYPCFSMSGLIQMIRMFLLKQKVYQEKSERCGSSAEWPGEAYSHGSQGYREALMTRKSHQYCVCGSGEMISACTCGYGKRWQIIHPFIGRKE